MSIKKLTKKQQEIFDYIISYCDDNGFPPTKKEIAEHFNQNTSGINGHLIALQSKNFIRLLYGVARGIQIIKLADFYTPMVGEVSAGAGIFTEGNITGSFDPVGNKDIPKGCFGFEVRGESMIEAGILPKDTVIVDPSVKPTNGNMGVILIENEVTIKYIFYKKDNLILRAANQTMKDRIVKTNDPTLNIVGSVVAVWRNILKRGK
jgi:repressor LexA